MRQYTKLDHRLEHQDNPGHMVSRLLQVAMSEPKGPVYLSVPREVAMLQAPGATRFPTRDQMGLASQAWPDPADSRRAAKWLIEAKNPAVYVGRAGRNAESVEVLVQLAELLALPVMGGRADRIRTSHHPPPIWHGTHATGRRRSSRAGVAASLGCPVGIPRGRCADRSGGS